MCPLICGLARLDDVATTLGRTSSVIACVSGTVLDVATALSATCPWSATSSVVAVVASEPVDTMPMTSGCCAVLDVESAPWAIWPETLGCCVVLVVATTLV